MLQTYHIPNNNTIETRKYIVLLFWSIMNTFYTYARHSTAAKRSTVYLFYSIQMS